MPVSQRSRTKGFAFTGRSKQVNKGVENGMSLQVSGYFVLIDQ